MYPQFTYIIIEQEDYRDIVDKDYPNKMAAPAPCASIN